MANQAQARGKRTVADRIRKLLANNDETSVEYLKESFLSAAMLTLARIRRESGLTQAEVAKRLKTKQSAIARTESDLAGSISLRRYVEIAAACGVMPEELLRQLGR